MLSQKLLNFVAYNNCNRKLEIMNNKLLIFSSYIVFKRTCKDERQTFITFLMFLFFFNNFERIKNVIIPGKIPFRRGIITFERYHAS